MNKKTFCKIKEKVEEIESQLRQPYTEETDWKYNSYNSRLERKITSITPMVSIQIQIGFNPDKGSRKNTNTTEIKEWTADYIMFGKASTIVISVEDIKTIRYEKHALRDVKVIIKEAEENGI
jgi:epoxyqueuosine reductase QueG